MIGSDHPSSSLGDVPEGDVDMDHDADPATPRAHFPTPSAAEPSNDDGPDEGHDQMVRYIWGTNINISEAMTDFRNFIRDFKPKYRGEYNTEQAKLVIEAGGIAPPPMSLYDKLTPARAEVVLYEEYLTQMRETGESVLNIDAINLLAFKGTKRLYHQLINYPQEMVPIMDQVLKDAMTEMADEELEKARGKHMDGDLTDAELSAVEGAVRDVEGRVYKTRPFGGETTINMRDLNPGGQLLFPL